MANPSTSGDPRCIPFMELKTQVTVIQSLMEHEQLQIAKECSQLNVLFQSQVQILTWGNWPAQQRSLLQSIRVEMHKQLRLLTTDLMFLQAAKQAETQAQRRQEVCDRLTNLQGYCDAIIKLAEDPAPVEQ